MYQEKNTMFMRLHPVVNVVYFLVIIGITMFFLQPVLLGITSVVSFVYLVYLGGKKQLADNLMVIPFLLAFSFINPIFNQSGATIICYLGKRKITLEAVMYGMVAVEMIFAMILVFRVFHLIMDSEKVMCMLSRGFPMGALLFTMTLRFVPMYKAQLVKMQTAQKGIGITDQNWTRMEKIKNGVGLLSGLMTWALENAIETAQAMKGRGFGLAGRTCYTNMKFTKIDGWMLGMEGLCSGLFLYACFTHRFQMTYYPIIKFGGCGSHDILYYSVYALFVAFPIILDLREEITWFYLRRSI